MKLSEFKPVMVCTACEVIILVWEDGLVDTGEETKPRKVGWRSKDWFFESEPVKCLNVSRIAAHWACCPGCAVAPLALRQTAARHTEPVWYDLTWLSGSFERRWFLAEHLKLKSKAGSVSLASDEQEPE